MSPNRDGVDSAEIEDVVFGCGPPEGATGRNIARKATLEAGVCTAGGMWTAA